MDYTIINNTEKNRFELSVDNTISVVEYKLFNGGINFMHTEVPESLQGKGLASILAKYVLDYATAEKLNVIASCPFIYAYIKRHPEYQHLLLRKDI